MIYRLTIWILMGLLSPILLGQQFSWQYFADSVGTFSSPRATDLNGDGIKDIVLGAGLEQKYSNTGILALDGQNGQLLWRVPARDQIYGSAVFLDINGDQTEDVIMAGRSAQLLALDGTDGTEIWNFFPDSLGDPYARPWYNFYLPQLVADQNSDGISDLVITNGGDARKLPIDTLRATGFLMLISGSDGQVLALDTMPDGRETYHSPLLVPNEQGEIEILFGTGGETIRGGYWQTTLSDLLSGQAAERAQLLASDTLRGFVACPALADMNADGTEDVLLPRLNGALLVLDGKTGQEIWRYELPGADHYVTPTPGDFNGDGHPDVFAIFAEGPVWPFYHTYREVVLDGRDGTLLWQDSVYYYQLSGANALDWDGDGVDEILIAENTDAGFFQVDYRNRFFLIDINDQQKIPLGSERAGLNPLSTPLITDLDDDGDLELIFAWNNNNRSWYGMDGVFVSRIDLNRSRSAVAWGGYQGTEADGRYQSGGIVALDSDSDFDFELELIPYPSPTRGWFALSSSEVLRDLRVELIDQAGRSLKEWNGWQETFLLPRVLKGLYLLRIETAQGVVMRKIMVF